MNQTNVFFLQNASEKITSQCYFYDLNSENPTNVWNSSISMNKSRLDAALAAVKDEANFFQLNCKIAF